MAKVLGVSGRYVSEDAIFQSRRILVLTVSIICAISVMEGLLISSFLPVRLIPAWLRLATSIAVLPAMVLLVKRAGKRYEAMERRRGNMRRGAAGEILVGDILGNFPEEFFVINDLTTPFGNLDHIVIGPTGVFVLDAKNWRGAVAADGAGELLLNGKMTDKPYIRSFTGRMLGIRDRVRALVPTLEPYFQGVFVFTAARVDANWGSTGNVHCIRDDQVFEYIVERDSRRRIKPDDARQIAQAFRALARMDQGFSKPPAEPASGPKDLN